MSNIANQLRTKKAALIGVGVVIVITACTLLTWKASNNKKDNSKKGQEPVTRSVKEQKVTTVDNNETIKPKQSQAETQQVIVEEQAIVVEKENNVEKVIVEEKVAEIQLDESLSLKSQSVSTITVDEETEISTPEPDVDVKQSEPASIMATNTQQESTVTENLDEMKVEEEKVEVTDELKEELEVLEQPEEFEQLEEIEQPKEIEGLEKIEEIKEEIDWSTMKEEASLVIEKQPMELSVESVDTQEDMSSLKEDFVVVESVDKSTPASKSPTVLNSSLHATAPEFVPKAAQQPQQQKKPSKKYLTREQLIEQQRQHHIPKSKARCSHWPHCTNNNCKFFHPYRACRAGDDCMFGDRCMFVHPNDCVVPVRENNHQKTKSSNNNTATKNNTAASSVTVE